MKHTLQQERFDVQNTSYNGDVTGLTLYFGGFIMKEIKFRTLMLEELLNEMDDHVEEFKDYLDSIGGGTDKDRGLLLMMENERDALEELIEKYEED